MVYFVVHILYKWRQFNITNGYLAKCLVAFVFLFHHPVACWFNTCNAVLSFNSSLD
uniref:Uncharacterized protein n=1 Tax=Anguilla anguilla TaxID=7936 RepID=A0A0E9RXU3_ANGAN